MKRKHNLLYRLFFIASFLVPFVVAIGSIFMGSIPFWYDPARDLFLGLGNHEKLSLIGQTSGIPGIFYGPYWIWLLSLALFISLDPRIIAFLVLTIPYFILFPLILFRLTTVFDKVTILILWLLFILAFSEYTTQLWNPHHAPLLCLLTIYLLVATDYKKTTWKPFLMSFAAGISGGLLMNTHISFGLAVFIGSFLFLLFWPSRRKTIPLFIAGFLIVFAPFFLFEVRHGFQQLTTLIQTLTSSSSVVRETSFDKMHIFSLFFNKLGLLLQIPALAGYLLAGGIAGYFVWQTKKHKQFLTYEDRKLLLIIGLISLTTLEIYLLSKNPVWEYHFIGVEILFLLFIGLGAKKIIVLRYALIGLVIILTSMHIADFAKSFSADPYKVSTLKTKEHIIDTIYQDAGTKSFSVYTYSPATFTPDYDYLLLWKGREQKGSRFTKDGTGEYVYLIIPWTTKDLKADFIDNRTPNENFKTEKNWHIPDETDILKRVRYEEK